jgi:hypothetical protein
MVKKFNDSGRTSDCNCSPNPNASPQKGVTIWQFENPEQCIFLPPNSTSEKLYFTFTRPRCYQGDGGTQVCNVNYKIETTADSQNDDVGPIWMVLNETQPPYRPARVSVRYHSKRKNHDLTETIDIAMAKENGQPILNKFGANWITFVNYDSNVGVYIKGLKIVRTYQVCGLLPDYNEECNGSGVCLDEQPYPTQPDYAPRHDYPCNLDGGGVSWTDFWYDDHVKRIHPGETVYWDWTIPDDFDNYVGKLSCFFNFNNIHLSGPSDLDDVKFSIKVNDSAWVDFWQSKNNNHPASHSVDLATHSVLSAAGGYRDWPNAINRLYLKLDPQTDAEDKVDLVNCDGCDDPNKPCPGICPEGCDECDADGGRVNLYRAYQTENVNECQVGCEVSCQGCYAGQGCFVCYGFCQTCVALCEACESGYNWCEICESGFNWPCWVCESGYDWCQYCETGYNWCELCESGYEYWPCQICESCYNCYTGCQECEITCQGCEITCEEGCQPCENCQSGCLTCEPGCYDCQSCYNCEPSCYDFQICYLCQENCYDCEACYVLY